MTTEMLNLLPESERMKLNAQLRLFGEIHGDADLIRSINDWELTARLLTEEVKRRTDLEAELARERQIVADLAEEVENPTPCEGSRGGEKFCGRCPGCVLMATTEATAQRERADGLARAGAELKDRLDTVEAERESLATELEGARVQLETVAAREAETVAQLRSQIAQLEQALDVATEEARAALERAESPPLRLVKSEHMPEGMFLIQPNPEKE